MPTDTLEETDSDSITPDELVRCSGMLKRFKQKAFDIRLYEIAQAEGFEIAHLSHRRHPVVEAVFYDGVERTPGVDLRLRSRFYRLFSGSNFRVRKERLFIRCRRSVIRMVCVPDWD